MKVSINIAAWNGEKYIEGCLKSIINQSFLDYAILIIDNGSTDKTVSIIREMFPQLKVVCHKENIGFAKAHNQALHWTKSDYVLCLNQDVILKKDFLEKAVAFLDQNKDCAAVSGKLLKLSEDSKEEVIDSTGLKIFKKLAAGDRGEGEADNNQYDKTEEVFGVSAAAAVYRREALEEIKYKEEFFDEDFFSYKEDVDLSFRLRYLGWKVYFLPEAVAYHVRTVGKAFNKKSHIARKQKSDFANFYSYRNQLLVIAKNRPKGIGFFLPVFFYELLKFFYVLFFEHKSWKAWPQYFKLRKKMKEKRKLIMEKKKVDNEEIKRWFKM